VERRTFLVLGAMAVGLTGCTRGSVEPVPTSSPPRSPAPTDPDSRLRDEVAASEVALIAAYRAAIGSTPELAAELEPFLAHHEQHLARVAPGFPAGPASPSASTSGSPSPSASASPSVSASTPGSSSTTSSEPSDTSVGRTLAELAAAEAAAQNQRAAGCNGAADPALARDLCLIAASEAQHAAALERLAAQGSES
jgi:hypothetical protein